MVIFDEASQVPIEDAVPAMSRAPQVIVVGDEMQLPPTSFFSTAPESEDVEIVAEEDGERVTINLDADNLLTQSARNLPAAMLAWHYRSRHEALISFSNAAFYEGRLTTVPDRLLVAPAVATEAAEADAEAAIVAGVDRLLERPISYHRLADGLYLDRANQPEARYIAGLVRELLRRETGLSIGIVAFSESQQEEIEGALDRLAADDADFAARLEREQIREDEDQFNGLFVKNLENVQGDERDLILLSICYGRGQRSDADEFRTDQPAGRREALNVIFSRAGGAWRSSPRSMPGRSPTLTTTARAALRGFLDYARANAAGALEQAQAILAPAQSGRRRFLCRAGSTASDPLGSRGGAPPARPCRARGRRLLAIPLRSRTPRPGRRSLCARHPDR